MPPGGQNFLVVVGDAAQTQHLHRLRQIDRPAMGVLGVDGCDHQALAKKQLVVHLPGVEVGRVVKSQRPEVRCVLKRSFHELTVEVGQEGIPQIQHIADGGQNIGKAVKFLLPALASAWLRMRGVNSPNSSQRSARSGVGVLTETAQIGTAVEEAAHLDGRHHLDVGQQLAPRGVVVAQPDPAPTVAPMMLLRQ